jgi:hypothetical protein
MRVMATNPCSTFVAVLTLIAGCAHANPPRNTDAPPQSAVDTSEAEATGAASPEASNQATGEASNDPAVEPTNEPTTEATEAADAPTIDLLQRAEEAANELHTLRARLRYDRVQGLLGDRQRRFGELIYVAGGEEHPPRFSVHLTRLLVDGKPREIDKRYVYDGRWLAEIDGEARTFIRRELVPEGERGRLLEMGEGPFALPLNMKVEAVRQRFQVEDITQAEATDTPTLRLVPRAGYDVGLDQITIEYDAKTMLPRAATTVEDAEAGELSILRLFDTQTGVEIADGAFDTTPPEDGGWDVQIVEIVKSED